MAYKPTPAGPNGDREMFHYLWRELNGVGDAISGVELTPGPEGPQGPEGPAGPAGEGVPPGGDAGQVLSKIDATDYNTQWTDPTGGGGLPEAPIDGAIYGREDAGWKRVFLRDLDDTAVDAPPAINDVLTWDGANWINIPRPPGFTGYWDEVTGGINYAGGFVGIGNTAPGSMLDVRGAAPRIRISDSAATSDLDTNALINFRNFANDGQNAQIGFRNDELLISTQTPTGFITLRTNGGNEKVRIDANGNVGIGTTTPAVPLHVDSGGPIRVNNTGSNATLQFYKDGVESCRFFDTGSLATWRAAAGTGIKLDTDGANERVRITAVGNVGIGTNNPQDRLSVNLGNANDEWRSVKLANIEADTNAFAQGAGIAFVRPTNSTALLSAIGPIEQNGALASFSRTGFRWYTGGGGDYTQTIEVARFDDAGSLMLGATSSATNRLRVNGDAGLRAAAFYRNGAPATNAVVQFNSDQGTWVIRCNGTTDLVTDTNIAQQLEIDTLNSQVAALQAALASVNSNGANLQAQVDALEAAFNTHKNAGAFQPDGHGGPN